MITKDTLILGQEARTGRINGIRKISRAVGGTMGTGGSNVQIEALENPGYLSTNDGATILASTVLADPIEDMGRKILLEAVSRANKASGDGSSTTCVLTAAIIEEGLKYVGKVSPMELKRSLEDCIPFIEESINKQKREVTVDTIGQVASISAEDDKIGALIQEIYQQIGSEGIIHWDISKTTEDSYTIGKGITVNGATYYSPYMCDAQENGQSTNQIRIKNPTVLITKQKITSAAEFNTLFETLFNKDIKDIVVFCDEVDPLVVPDLIKTRMVRGFRTILVKMPVLWKDVWYEDLAKASGATIADATAGLAIRNANLTHLGKFDNILITKEDTYIDGIADISEHLKQLAEDGSDEALLRLSRLNTKTARLFVGAQSDSALSYKRLKVEDALGASYNSLRGGIVPGGGVALLDCINDLPLTIGGKILSKALRSPYRQILKNAGYKRRWFDWVFTENKFNGGGNGIGINSIDIRHWVDMFEEGIINPAPTELHACRNAISVGSSILSTDVVVLLPREEQQSVNPPVMR